MRRISCQCWVAESAEAALLCSGKSGLYDLALEGLTVITTGAEHQAGTLRAGTGRSARSHIGYAEDTVSGARLTRSTALRVLLRVVGIDQTPSLTVIRGSAYEGLPCGVSPRVPLPGT